MTQYLLALYRDYAVPFSPERIEQVWAGVNALGDRLEDAGAFVFKGGHARGRGVSDRGARVRTRLPDYRRAVHGD